MRSLEYNGAAPSRLFKKDLNKYTLGFYLFWTAHDEHILILIYMFLFVVYLPNLLHSHAAHEHFLIVFTARGKIERFARENVPH